MQLSVIGYAKWLLTYIASIGTLVVTNRLRYKKRSQDILVT